MKLVDAASRHVKTTSKSDFSQKQTSQLKFHAVLCKCFANWGKGRVFVDLRGKVWWIWVQLIENSAGVYITTESKVFWTLYSDETVQTTIQPANVLMSNVQFIIYVLATHSKYSQTDSQSLNEYMYHSILLLLQMQTSSNLSKIQCFAICCSARIKFKWLYHKMGSYIKTSYFV